MTNLSNETNIFKNSDGTFDFHLHLQSTDGELIALISKSISDIVVNWTAENNTASKKLDLKADAGKIWGILNSEGFPSFPHDEKLMINSIKRIRELTGCGLSEAVDFAEANGFKHPRKEPV